MDEHYCIFEDVVIGCSLQHFLRTEVLVKTSSQLYKLFWLAGLQLLKLCYIVWTDLNPAVK